MDPGLAPVSMLIAVTAGLFLLGVAGVRRLRHWSVAVRGGVAALFITTGLVHFVGMRAELIAMVPPGLPVPALLVTITGILELAGAVGVLWSRTAPWAAAGLTLLLLGMFPANVYKALNGPVTSVMDELVPRSAMQVVFLAATASLVVYYWRRRNTPADEPELAATQA
ncbi:DoxX family protein [Ruania halotolerans]|uniref:DoxX family protein n=1 Tax=Ruania halotolerans TaxID=2897773 RepID=UPI001E29FEEC|nr:DoxX family protein [Ruania halotolerans]UFU07887.1 DoxX family protein [Ruania halotolerans]